MSDEMCHHFMNKSIPEFWKNWNAKFKKDVTKNVNINGYVTDTGIANAFAAHFKNDFHSSHDDKANNEFIRKRDECIKADPQSCYRYVDKISVELIDNCVKKLQVGKACGPDDIGAEHILYAHPVLIMHLQTLFKFILCHRFVPNSFGIGVTFPQIYSGS